MVVLISDLCEGNSRAKLYGICRDIIESGAKLIALTALNGEGSPCYDRTTGEHLAGLGAYVGAMPPARLPDLERALRSLHGEYAAYFTRSAAYRDTALLRRFSQAFRLASALEAADQDGIQALAGIFREEYEPVDRLKLSLLGLRDFTGQSGYAGTIYDFWEEQKGGYYTFSQVRPTFYEENAGRLMGTARPSLSASGGFHGAERGQGNLRGKPLRHRGLQGRPSGGEVPWQPPAQGGDFFTV